LVDAPIVDERARHVGQLVLDHAGTDRGGFVAQRLPFERGAVREQPFGAHAQGA
jgi:hypothetical protein